MCLSLLKWGNLIYILFIICGSRRLVSERTCPCPFWNQSDRYRQVSLTHSGPWEQPLGWAEGCFSVTLWHSAFPRMVLCSLCVQRCTLHGHEKLCCLVEIVPNDDDSKLDQTRLGHLQIFVGHTQFPSIFFLLPSDTKHSVRVLRVYSQSRDNTIILSYILKNKFNLSSFFLCEGTGFETPIFDLLWINDFCSQENECEALCPCNRV